MGSTTLACVTPSKAARTAEASARSPVTGVTPGGKSRARAGEAAHRVSRIDQAPGHGAALCAGGADDEDVHGNRACPTHRLRSIKPSLLKFKDRPWKIC
ncbi:hypothetical protein GCM10018965_095340 [Nonomuraea roseola]